MPEPCPAWLATGLSAIRPCDRPPQRLSTSRHWRTLVNSAFERRIRSCFLRWTPNCVDVRNQDSCLIDRHLGRLGNAVVTHALDPEDPSTIDRMRRQAARTKARLGVGPVRIHVGDEELLP